jgi:hypothetical protein
MGLGSTNMAKNHPIENEEVCSHKRLEGSALGSDMIINWVQCPRGVSKVAHC